MLKIRKIVIGAVAGAVSFAFIPTASASSDPRAELLDMVNVARYFNSAPPLQLDESLSAAACEWNNRISAAGVLAHDPNLVAMGSLAPGWSKMGENLGAGDDIPQVFDALANSPAHLANMLDPAYTKTGICVTTGRDGNTVITQRFVAYQAPKARYRRRRRL